MRTRYPLVLLLPTQRPAVILTTAALLLSASAWGQAPTITGLSPTPNARAVPRTSPVTVTFSQPLTAPSAAALKVYSAQRGGLRSRGATPATVSGTTLTFAPTAYDFRPGEVVSTIVTQAAASSGGVLAAPRVQQFTAAVGGTGRGLFSAGPTMPNYAAEATAIGDLNNDGFPDAVNASTSRTYLSVGLGNALNLTDLGGAYVVNVNTAPSAVALADVNDDGYLDILATNQTSATVSIRLNYTGTAGYFAVTGTQNVATGAQPKDLATGDVDGDGDLDVVVATATGLEVLLNDGTGVFTNTRSISVGTTPTAVALGDVDGDGDLDMVSPNYGAMTVSVRVNDGHGLFSGSQEITTGNGPRAVALGDVDGDGDLDIAISCARDGAVRLAINNGVGLFTGGQRLAFQTDPYGVALGDLDADGDLDLAMACAYDGRFYLAFNNGAGVFTSVPSLAGGSRLSRLVLADVDRDSDLDLVAANESNLIIALNGGTGVLATAPARKDLALTLHPNPSAAGTTLSYELPTAASVRVEVIDALGRRICTLVAEQQLPGAHVVAVPQLPAGLYTVCLYLDNVATYTRLCTQ